MEPIKVTASFPTSDGTLTSYNVGLAQNGNDVVNYKNSTTYQTTNTNPSNIADYFNDLSQPSNSQNMTLLISLWIMGNEQASEWMEVGRSPCNTDYNTYNDASWMSFGDVIITTNSNKAQKKEAKKKRSNVLIL
jgi:hypothetical protein